MNVYDAQGKPVLPTQSIGRGGEATVYQVQGYPDWLAKIYDRGPRSNYPYKLAWMMSHPPQNPTGALNHPSLAWPDGLLYDAKGQMLGYRMPYIRKASPILDVFNPRRRAEIMPRFDRRYLHRAARNLAAALGALHRSDYVAGDINESNVLVTPSALVSLIDTDSFQVKESRGGLIVVHYCPVGKPEYTPPEMQGQPLDKVQRSPYQDAFGLGVLVFQLLMGGGHPFRAQWLGKGDPPPLENRIAMGGFPYMSSPPCPVQPPKNAPDFNLLHPAISELVRRCFVDGHRSPELRPLPGEWERAIAEAETCLVTCERGHIYSNHLDFCPHCPPGSRPVSRPAPQRRENPQQETPARQTPFGPPRPQPAWSTASAGTVRPSGPTRPVRAGSSSGSQGPSASPFARPAPAAAQAGASPPAAAAGTAAASSTAAGTAPFNTRQPFSRPVWRQAPAGAGASTASVPWWQQPGRPSSSWPGSFRVPGSGSSTGTARWPFVQIYPRGSLWQWLRPRLYKSVVVGGGMGALAGVLPGAVLGAASFSLGDVAAWSAFWALGGAFGGMLRGWKPGYRLGLWVNQHIGWSLVWQALGLVGGAIGGMLGGLLFAWAIFPIFIGLFAGARLGLAFGKQIGQAGNRVGWERIWAYVGAGSAALLGWLIAGWAGMSGLGGSANHLASGMSAWLAAQQVSGTLAWTAVGALGGAFGGAVAGMLSDLLSRAAGLAD